MLLFFLLVGDFSILPKLLIPLLVVMVGGPATSIFPMSIESGDFIVLCVGKDAFGTGLFISLIVQLGREMNKACHQPTYNQLPLASRQNGGNRRQLFAQFDNSKASWLQVH